MDSWKFEQSRIFWKNERVKKFHYCTTLILQLELRKCYFYDAYTDSQLIPSKNKLSKEWKSKKHFYCIILVLQLELRKCFLTTQF